MRGVDFGRTGRPHELRARHRRDPRRPYRRYRSPRRGRSPDPGPLDGRLCRGCRMISAGRNNLVAGLGGSAAFLLAAMVFLFAIGRPPLTTLGQMALYAFGDSDSISESFVKATPILLCALAVILPARLGLISVGGEGQLYFGALTGTAIVVWFPHASIVLLLPAMLAAGSLGGALWGGAAGLLRARCNVNETISTLL